MTGVGEKKKNLMENFISLFLFSFLYFCFINFYYLFFFISSFLSYWYIFWAHFLYNPNNSIFTYFFRAFQLFKRGGKKKKLICLPPSIP